jgi:hypothetical protein
MVMEWWWEDLRRYPDSAIAARKRRQLLLAVVAVTVAAIVFFVLANHRWTATANAPSASTSASTACAVLANGNQLCGEQLAAWCNGFVTKDSDPNTLLACNSAGVDVLTQSQQP